MQKMTVGVLTFNRKHTLARALESIYDQGYDNIEVIVVDNNSSDGSAEFVRKNFSKVKLIRLTKNLGCPGGRNIIYANATGDFIVNLDDDAYLGENALQRLVEVFNSDERIGIVSMGVRFIGKDENIVNDKGWFDVGTFRGTASAIRRTMINQIGGYPEHFFMMDEEQHLSIRAFDAGYRIVHCAGTYVWHPLEDGTGSRHFDYYRYRNALLVVVELFPGWLLIKYLFLRMGSNALFAIRRGSFGKYLAAVTYVLITLPIYLISRRPCSFESVSKYMSLRNLVAGNYGLKNVSTNPVIEKTLFSKWERK